MVAVLEGEMKQTDILPKRMVIIWEQTPNSKGYLTTERTKIGDDLEHLEKKHVLEELLGHEL